MIESDCLVHDRTSLLRVNVNYVNTFRSAKMKIFCICELSESKSEVVYLLCTKHRDVKTNAVDIFKDLLFLTLTLTAEESK